MIIKNEHLIIASLQKISIKNIIPLNSHTFQYICNSIFVFVNLYEIYIINFKMNFREKLKLLELYNSWFISNLNCIVTKLSKLRCKLNHIYFTYISWVTLLSLLFFNKVVHFIIIIYKANFCWISLSLPKHIGGNIASVFNFTVNNVGEEGITKIWLKIKNQRLNRL